MPRSDKVPGSGTATVAMAGIELARMPPNPMNASNMIFLMGLPSKSHRFRLAGTVCDGCDVRATPFN